MIWIEVDIQNHKVNAIIDTGAQDTILNDHIFDQLQSKPYRQGNPASHSWSRDGHEMSGYATNVFLYTRF